MTNNSEQKLNNKQTHKKATNETPETFSIKFYMYHFPNGQNALVLPLNDKCVDVEIEHVYPTKSFDTPVEE